MWHTLLLEKGTINKAGRDSHTDWTERVCERRTCVKFGNGFFILLLQYNTGDNQFYAGLHDCVKWLLLYH